MGLDQEGAHDLEPWAVDHCLLRALELEDQVAAGIARVGDKARVASEGHRCGCQLGLARVPAVDRGLANTRGAGDSLDRHACVRVLSEQLERSVENRLRHLGVAGTSTYLRAGFHLLPSLRRSPRHGRAVGLRLRVSARQEADGDGRAEQR